MLHGKVREPHPWIWLSSVSAQKLNPTKAAIPSDVFDNRIDNTQPTFPCNYVAASMPSRVISIPNPGASLGIR